MPAETIRLTRVGTVTIEGIQEIVPPEYPGGRIVNLRYLLEGIGKNGQNPGRLYVYEDMDRISVNPSGLAKGVKILDTEEDGRVRKYDGRSFRWRTTLDIIVIQTEIWKNDIGVRIRHFD